MELSMRVNGTSLVGKMAKVYKYGSMDPSMKATGTQIKQMDVDA